jgi:hypothetical protein
MQIATRQFVCSWSHYDASSAPVNEQHGFGFVEGRETYKGNGAAVFH